MRSHRLSIALPLSILLALAARPLVAQARLPHTEPDSLGLPADTVRLPLERRVGGMGRCDIHGHAVVKDRADLRRLRRHPQCAKVAPTLDGRTLVGLSVMADCQASYRVDAFRSAKRREFRVHLRIRSGGCRGLLPVHEWLSLPALPPGWTLRITESDVDPDAAPNSWEWMPLDPSRH